MLQVFAHEWRAFNSLQRYVMADLQLHRAVGIVYLHSVPHASQQHTRVIRHTSHFARHTPHVTRHTPHPRHLIHKGLNSSASVSSPIGSNKPPAPFPPWSESTNIPFDCCGGRGGEALIRFMTNPLGCDADECAAAAAAAAAAADASATRFRCTSSALQYKALTLLVRMHAATQRAAQKDDWTDQRRTAA
jgi:hypothetical protein